MEMRSCYIFLVGHDGHESESKKQRGKDPCNRDGEKTESDGVREKMKSWREWDEERKREDEEMKREKNRKREK